jgi:hypothetical protein
MTPQSRTDKIAAFCQKQKAARKNYQTGLKAGDEVEVFWNMKKNAKARVVKPLHNAEGWPEGDLLIVEWISDFVPKTELNLVWFEWLRCPEQGF